MRGQPLARTLGCLMLAACGASSRATNTTTSPAPAERSRAPTAYPTSRAALVRTIDSLVAQPAFRNAYWGILIVDPERGDTLYSLNAGKLFMPGSNVKIVTGAVALALLGPEFRFRTTVASRGPVRGNGTLAGDLLVIGRGDPTMNVRFHADDLAALMALADSLLARGVRRVDGRVLAWGDAFPDAPYGFGWSWEDLVEGFGAGVDELMVAEGAMEVTLLAGARAGDPARVTVAPDFGHPRVESAVRTVSPDTLVAGDAAPALLVRRDATAGAIVITGTIALGETRTLEIPFPDQRAAALAALEHALRARGIAITGRARTDTAAAVDTLFTIASPPLAQILPAMEKPSHNQMAEALFKTLGLERGGAGTSAAARKVVDSTLLAWGAASDGFVLRDGSGVSRYNYVTPETIVRVLDRMYRDSLFALWRDALPAAGREGTLESRMRDTPAEGVVRAKTGFVTGARTLSGYAPTADGRTLIFSLLCNNWTVPTREVEAVQDAIAARLVTLGAGTP